MQRKRNLPAKVSEQELKELADKARAAGSPSLAAWIRERLGLPQVRVGAPAGNRNRRKKGD